MPAVAVDLLRELVAFDTSNPPRAITTGGIVACAADTLRAAGFEVSIDDLGEGCVNVLAVRGRPSLLFNVHLDTVPADGSWTDDPFALRVEGDLAVGLGACDVKGSAACLLAAARRTTGPAAILLSTDEEAGTSRCVRTFLEDRPAFVEAVVVAEPTGLRAATAHRGMVSCEIEFSGRAGHTSRAGGVNALHRAVAWGHEAIGDAGDDLRFNVGVIRGGTKANVVASSAHVVFGFRALPGVDVDARLERLRRALGDDDAWRVRFRVPALQETPASAALARALGLGEGHAVDFWTEAALFAEAGCPAIVYGPGSIDQAHTAGEWVSVAQLGEATDFYARLMTG